MYSRNTAQFIKDFCAIPIFITMSMQTIFSKELLMIFFALGGILDTLFVCYFYWHGFPWTIARIKDALGAYGMLGFVFIIAAANQVHQTGRWPFFFIFAMCVDTISVCSIFTDWNVYTTTPCLQTLS